MFQRLAHSMFLKKNKKHYMYTYFTLHCFRDPKSFSVCNIKYTLVHVNMICCYQNRSREVLHRYTEDVLEAFLIIIFFLILFFVTLPLLDSEDRKAERESGEDVQQRAEGRTRIQAADFWPCGMWLPARPLS